MSEVFPWQVQLAEAFIGFREQRTGETGGVDRLRSFLAQQIDFPRDRQDSLGDSRDLVQECDQRLGDRPVGHRSWFAAADYHFRPALRARHLLRRLRDLASDLLFKRHDDPSSRDGGPIS